MYSSVFEAVSETLIMGIHDHSFKNGAFQSQISDKPPYTPVLECFDILINSPLLTTAEKNVVATCKDEYQKLGQKFPEGKGAGLGDASPLLDAMEELVNAFALNSSAQGLQNLLIIAKMNNDGTVEESLVVNADGSLSVHKGGVPGATPGAPAGFANNQEDNANVFGKSGESTENKPPGAGVAQSDATTVGETSKSSTSNMGEMKTFTGTEMTDRWREEAYCRKQLRKGFRTNLTCAYI